jgi:hypothetical protein
MMLDTWSRTVLGLTPKRLATRAFAAARLTTPDLGLTLG